MHLIQIKNKALELISKGKKTTQLSKIFEINLRTIQRWVKNKKDGIKTERIKQTRSRKINKDELFDYVGKNPDKTLKELSEIFKIHESCIFRHLKNANFTFKKNYIV